MIVIFLVDCLFAIPIFALQIAKTGGRLRDIITPLLFSRQDFQLGHKSLFNTLPVHELCLKFGPIVKKSTPEPTQQERQFSPGTLVGFEGFCPQLFSIAESCRRSHEEA